MEKSEVKIIRSAKSRRLDKENVKHRGKAHENRHKCLP